MPLRIGIIGLPNAGKSTLFHALTRAAVEIAGYPFTTIEPNVGVVPIPDPRLGRIASATHPERVVSAAVEFVDVAGLVRGAHRGEGLGNRFLSHIRDADAVVHVVRAFHSGAVPHVEGEPDPLRDTEIVDIELALADLATVERAQERAASEIKAQQAGAHGRAALLHRVGAALGGGVALRGQPLSDPERRALAELRLLSAKPVLYVANTDEGAGTDAALAAYAASQGGEVMAVAAKLEAELADLPPDDAGAFRESLGLAEPGLHRLIRAAFHLLDLVTFFSVASAEVRAWPVPRGTTAPHAAGRIHTDMERGFIRAEVIGVEDLAAAGSLAAARDAGRLRLEGKEYVVRDGDVITFRFAA